MKKLILLSILLLMITPISQGQEAIESFDDKNTSVLNDQNQDYWRRIRKLQTNSATEAYVELKFNTTTGHDHDGTDAKKVIATNLDMTGITNGHALYNNAGTLAGKAFPEDLSLKSVTTATGTNSGNITIEPSKQYMATVNVYSCNSDSLLYIYVNDDTDGPYSSLAGDAQARIDTLNTDRVAIDGSDGALYGTLYIDTYKVGTPSWSFVTHGSLVFKNHLDDYKQIDTFGIYDSNVTVSSFEFSMSGTCSITVRLYELAQS